MSVDIEISTSAVVLASSSALLNKLLGPTAEYLGNELQSFVQKRIENVRRIFSIAQRRLGDKLEEPGIVSPRVLKRVIGEGSFCEDALSLEYFGGVLASSRNKVGRDDRGSAFMELIGRLSTYQIRSHYILYTVMKRLYDGTGLNVGLDVDRKKMRTYVPLSTYVVAMEFAERERPDLILEHVIYGLVKEQLIGSDFAIGSPKTLPTYFKEGMEPGFIVEPSGLGIELYLWAHGRSDLAMKEFINRDIQFAVDVSINIPLGYKNVSQ